MIEIQHTYYQCEVCKCQYTDADVAREREKIPINNPTGVKVGDSIRLSDGETAVVQSVDVSDCTTAEHRTPHQVSVTVLYSDGGRDVFWDGFEIVTQPKKTFTIAKHARLIADHADAIVRLLGELETECGCKVGEQNFPAVADQMRTWATKIEATDCGCKGAK
jgi:hypothetical protein